MPTLPGQELASLDFGNLIGGPLNAIVKAQALAAMTTVDFIRQVGFVDPTDYTAGLNIVTFKYDKEVPDATTGAPTTRSATVTVPLLTILPIPYIRVEESTINFLAKINQVEYKDTSTQFNISGSLDVKAKWGWGSAELKVSAAYQRNTKEGNTTTRDYSMSINVKAVQDDIPAGMSRVLGILEAAIVEKTV